MSAQSLFARLLVFDLVFLSKTQDMWSEKGFLCCFQGHESVGEKHGLETQMLEFLAHFKNSKGEQQFWS